MIRLFSNNIRHNQNKAQNKPSELKSLPLSTAASDTVVSISQYRQILSERNALELVRSRNKQMNICCGIDIDYLEKFRIYKGVFLSSLAELLGITTEQLTEYINFDKACNLSFAENWEISLNLLATKRAEI